MSRQPERKLTARPRMKALGGDGALTALWVALHVPAALVIGHDLTDEATAAAAASSPAPVAMADDAASPP
ncbi:hypothetical protein [Streptomyces sp. NPDC046988]|uniref:hypothetical protein n=1 Tax=Streptomyces sp. NPDC046988 TaxID=3154922 RepID=UPI003403C652